MRHFLIDFKLNLSLYYFKFVFISEHISRVPQLYWIPTDIISCISNVTTVWLLVGHAPCSRSSLEDGFMLALFVTDVSV